MSLPRHGSYEHHRGEAERLYPLYRTALAKVEKHEMRVLSDCAGRTKEAAQRLSDAVVPRDWMYKALVGAKNGLLQQLEVEIGMATMCAAGEARR